jgi:hypothetical protein
MEGTENKMEAKARDFFAPMIWASLAIGLACFGLAAVRPLADAYILAGLGAWLAAAACAALRADRKQAQGDRETLHALLAGMTQGLHAGQSASVSEDQAREGARARAAQERGEALRQSLEQSLRSGLSEGFAALGAPLSGLRESLRADGEERAKTLAEIGGVIRSGNESQNRVAAAMEAFSDKLREFGAGWDQEQERRDAALGEALKKWEGLFARGAESLAEAVAQAGKALDAARQDAGSRLEPVAAQAETWLQALSQTASKLEAVFADAQRQTEAGAAQQTGFASVVADLRETLAGVLDRLQSLGSLGQGYEALLEKMEASIRRFEERSAEILEETALTAQESLLEALDRAAPETKPDRQFAPAEETTASHAD